MTVELAPVVEKRLGALPASEFVRRLDVASIIDELEGDGTLQRSAALVGAVAELVADP